MRDTTAMYLCRSAPLLMWSSTKRVVQAPNVLATVRRATTTSLHSWSKLVPSLRPQLDRSVAETTVALGLIARLVRGLPIPSHYIAELLLLRSFALFESVMEESACRLVCGASYCDGRMPQLLRHRPTKGIDKARLEMLWFNRDTPRNRLRWTSASDIAANLN